jgi:hypothetical protein
VWQIKRHVQEVLGKTPLRWGTVLQMPASFTKYTQDLERSRYFQRCPFGSFIGMVVTLVPRYQTQNVPIEYIRQPKGAVTGLMKTPTK